MARHDVAKALMAKLSLVYEDHDDRLLFNTVGIPLGGDDLSFVSNIDTEESTGDAAREQTEQAAEFARLVNRIPEVGAVWKPTDRLVWNEVQRALNPSQTLTATIELNEEREKKLAEAERVLYGEDREPGEVSEKYEAYKKYQRKYQEKEVEYNNARIDAEHATGEEKARADQRAKTLKDELDATMEEWKTRGYKFEIENALEMKSTIQSRLPHRRRSEARQKVNFETSRYQRTSVTSGTSFLLTRYLPAELYQEDSENWTSFTLSGDQISEMSRKAHTELEGLDDERLFSDGLDLTREVKIEEITFEMTRAEIVRPWFDPSILEARDWMWRSDQKPLSDGGDPPSGRMPLYVSSMILARNITVIFADDATAQAAEKATKANGALSIGPLVFDHTPATLRTERKLTGMRLNADLTTPALQHLRGLAPKILNATATDSESSSTSESGSSADGLGVVSSSELLHSAEANLARPLMTSQPISGTSSSSESKPDSGFHGIVAEEAGGSPIDGVRITFDQQDGSTRKTTQSNNGQYSIRLPEGKYIVTAAHPDYPDYSTKPGFFVVTGSEMQTGNIFMGDPEGNAADTSNTSADSTDPSPPDSERIKAIQVVAFGCTKLGPAPNPDPVLDFSG